MSNLSTQETKAGRFGVPGWPGLHSNFKASMCCIHSRGFVSIKQNGTNFTPVSSHSVMSSINSHHILVYCFYCHVYFCVLWHINLKCILRALDIFQKDSFISKICHKLLAGDSSHLHTFFHQVASKEPSYQQTSQRGTGVLIPSCFISSTVILSSRSQILVLEPVVEQSQ